MIEFTAQTLFFGLLNVKNISLEVYFWSLPLLNCVLHSEFHDFVQKKVYFDKSRGSIRIFEKVFQITLKLDNKFIWNANSKNKCQFH